MAETVPLAMADQTQERESVEGVGVHLVEHVRRLRKHLSKAFNGLWERLEGQVDRASVIVVSHDVESTCLLQNLSEVVTDDWQGVLEALGLEA